MSKEIEIELKKLLAKEKLTGDDVGRIMVLDLLVAYKSLAVGGDGNGFLEDCQKIKIVDNLVESSDISRYNDYRGIHDYLTSVGAIYDGFAKMYELHYWRVFHLMSNMKYSEAETRFSNSLPVIMTEEQYAEFLSSENDTPAGGIAVIKASGKKAGVANLPEWRAAYSAEGFLENHAVYVKNALIMMRDALCECLARQKALELVGRFIKVSRVKMLITPIDEKRSGYLNEFVENTIDSITRPNHPEEYERELKKKLFDVFTPIDISKLAPEAKAVTKARRMINFAVIKNSSEAFVSVLKREWRNDPSE